MLYNIQIQIFFGLEYQQNMEAINIFSEFILTIRTHLNYRQKLLEYESVHNLKKYKFTEISADNALAIFQQIVQKFYKSHGQGQSSTWFQNELKLYLWSVICYMQLNRKSLNSMKKQDWEFFSTIFYVKDTILFEYQAKSLFDQQNKQNKWQNQQDLILFNIIIKDQKSKWNQIAKSLWIVSKMKYIRSSKQCRERWLNHLDPNKSKCQWNIREYQVLFMQVLQKGKKWANIVKCLHDRRSQHSIKNRFNSIIRKQLKLTPELKQPQAVKQLLRKIQKIVQNNQMAPNDQFLFGSSLKVLGFQSRNWAYDQYQSQNHSQNPNNNKTHDKQSQQNRKRLDNFRKKIQKIQFKQSNSTETKPSRKSSFLSSSQKKQKNSYTHNFTSTPLKIHDNNSNYNLHHNFNSNFQSNNNNHNTHNMNNNDDQIFYEQSFDMQIDMSLNNMGITLNIDGSGCNNDHNNINTNMNNNMNMISNSNIFGNQMFLLNNNNNTNNNLGNNNHQNSTNMININNNLNHSNMMMVFNQDFKNVVDF